MLESPLNGTGVDNAAHDVGSRLLLKARHFNVYNVENKGAGWRATEVFFERAGYSERAAASTNMAPTTPSGVIKSGTYQVVQTNALWLRLRRAVGIAARLKNPRAAQGAR